jgi:hypothetical protein
MHQEIFGVTAFCKGGPRPIKPPAPPRPEDAVYGAKATVAARQRNARGFSSTILTGRASSILNPNSSTILGQYK